MIHILQSVSNMDRGGIESMLMNYYRHLDRTRFQFDFLVNKQKPGFFDDEIRALGGRIFQSPGVAPQSYPAYLRSMQQLLAQHPEIKVLHAHNEAMQLFALEGAKKAGLPVRIAHAHNTRLPKDAKLPIKWFCKQFIPGAATDYWACGREAGIYYFGQSAWDARGVTLRNAIDLALEQPTEAVELDFAQVSYIDSTGIGVLVGAAHHAADHGKRFSCVNVQSPVMRVVQLLGVDQEISITAA